MMPRLILLFLWAAIVNAFGDMTITYGYFDAYEGLSSINQIPYRFGECIPAVYRTGRVATEGVAGVPAICTQYQYEDCTGKRREQTFELHQVIQPISINDDSIRSFVCIKKLKN